MRNILSTLFLLMFVLTEVSAQDTRQFNQIDEDGNVTQRSENRNFNKNSNDTTKNKEIPKGHFAWTIDRRFGDVIPADKDTIHHLFMNTTFNTGILLQTARRVPVYQHTLAIHPGHLRQLR